MKTLTRIDELRAALDALPRPLALVPTMGNLHAGHLALAEAAVARARSVVASVFVNPTQFGNGEDFAGYPRTLARDRGLLEGAGVMLLFAPDEAQMYPLGATTEVLVEALSGVLCGAHRPGHFAGVTTVVSMLFNLVRPDLALFGEKDYQQLLVIRRMAVDLHFPVEVVGVPTVREPDGLALSSRNQYLSDAQRAVAPTLYQALTAAAAELAAGGTTIAAVEHNGERRLAAAGFEVDYFEVRRQDLSLPAPGDPPAALRVLAAARLGRARLIDNIAVT